MRQRWTAVAGAVLLVAGLVVVTATVAGRCAAGGDPGRIAGAGSGADVTSARQPTAEAESTAVATLATAGIPATPRWGLWSGVRGEDGTALPEITDVAVAGDRVVTAQLGNDDRRLLAGYAVADGTPLWSAALPRGRYEPALLLTAGPAPGSSAGPASAAGDGSVLVLGGGAVSAFDPASGELRWCVPVSGDARVSMLDTRHGALVAEQDADRSRLLLLDPGTGEQHWSRDYRVHDGGVAPVVAADVVAVYAAGDDGSGVHAFRLGTGEPAWSLTDELPQPFGAAGGVLLVRSRTGLHGVAAGSGAPRWSSDRFTPQLGPGAGFRAPQRPGDPALLLQPPAAGGVTAFDPATGAVRWELPGALLRPSVPHGVARADTAGDRLLLQGTRTGLVAVDPGTGRILGGAADTSPLIPAAGTAVVTGPLRTTVLSPAG
ncbi:PQQ-binding-like beta-propeller repeat protein [Pseudonocardia sp. NPDC046786]|uniref:outer membrane protein assembly factor BamB family protein n=1 Tax=Pseudonocardia sp. NPDC046786 TaxID=3155471 RepID=UPI0033C049BB